WRADDLVASELGYRSRTLGWYWAIRLHGASVSSFRVCLPRTGRGRMSVLRRIPRKAVAAALNSEKRVTILLRGLAAGLIASVPLALSTETFCRRRMAGRT